MITRVQRHSATLMAFEFVCVTGAYVLSLTFFAYKIAEAAGYLA